MVKRLERKYLRRKCYGDKVYWYFERGKFRVRLPDDPDSPEFDAAYWSARKGGQAKPPRVTFDRVIDGYLKSSRFRTKKPRTQQEYRRTLNLISEKNGTQDFTKLTRKHVLAAQEAYSDTWRKANAVVEMLSILSRHAIDQEWIERNPAEGIPKLKGGSYEPWPDDKLRAFENYASRLDDRTTLTIYRLCIGTGQRISDVIAMEWEHFDGRFMSVVQDKTSARLDIYCPDRLSNYLSKLPRSGKHILARNLTEHISRSMASKRVEAARKAIRAEAWKIHGWRYNAAKELAEAGCTDSEIAAVTGHSTLQMVQKYRAGASQRKLSKKAQKKRK